MPEFPDPSAPVEPVNLMAVVDLIQSARQNTSAGLVARETLVDVAALMFNELTVLRGTVQAYREDLEDADAYEKLGERDLVRSVRLEWSSIRAAVNPEVHTPARAVAYLVAHGWVKDSDRRGGENWHDAPDRNGRSRWVFVPTNASFVGWDKRMAELVRGLADAHGCGEMGVLAAIAAAAPGVPDAGQ